MALESLIRFPNAWSAGAPGFGLHLFEGRLTIGDMDRMQQVGDVWRARNPGRLVEMVVVFPSSARLSDDERKRLVQLVAHRERDRAASATVILAEGMQGAMQRSMLTALNLMRRPPHPAKVFSTVADGAAFLAPHYAELCGRGVPRLDLASAAAQECESFRKRPGAGSLVPR